MATPLAEANLASDRLNIRVDGSQHKRTPAKRAVGLEQQSSAQYCRKAQREQLRRRRVA